MIWCHKKAKFDACGPPLPFVQNLMPVVPPYHLMSEERKAIGYDLVSQERKAIAL